MGVNCCRCAFVPLFPSHCCLCFHHPLLLLFPTRSITIHSIVDCDTRPVEEPVVSNTSIPTHVFSEWLFVTQITLGCPCEHADSSLSFSISLFQPIYHTLYFSDHHPSPFFYSTLVRFSHHRFPVPQYLVSCFILGKGTAL